MNAAAKKEDYRPGEMLRTWQFYVLWFMYACGAGAGLMIISKLAKIASAQAGLTLGFVLVAVLAVGNGAGRVVAGMLSDTIGRKATLFIWKMAGGLHGSKSPQPWHPRVWRWLRGARWH